MKRLSIFLSFCLASTLYISCLNADRTIAFTEDTNHITSDELMYEIETANLHSTSQSIVPDTAKIKKESRLNNSTLQEMLVVYNHLFMSERQILLFEDQFNTKIKESSKNLPTQIEIQEIMDVSFETVLTEDQYIKYNDWRIVGPQ